jgi:hypothetical protein
MRLHPNAPREKQAHTHIEKERERYVILLLFFLIFFDTKSVLQVLVSSASDKPLMEQPFRDLLVTGTLLPSISLYSSSSSFYSPQYVPFYFSLNRILRLG